jgi:hypothetical protein
MRAIYYQQRRGGDGSPIVVIGVRLNPEYIEIVQGVIEELDIGSYIHLKEVACLEAISTFNLLNEVSRERGEPAIEVYIELVGSYRAQRYGPVAIKRACEKLAFILREEWDSPSIEVKGNNICHSIEESKVLTYVNKGEVNNAALVVANCYGLVIQKVYERDYTCPKVG